MQSFPNVYGKVLLMVTHHVSMKKNLGPYNNIISIRFHVLRRKTLILACKILN
jgi:hypothetical protein